MSLLKRKSKVLEKAQKRLAGLESIDANLDLGNGATVANYKAKVDALTGKVDLFNQSKSTHDGLSIEVRDDEKELRDINEKILEAVGVKFGHDSEQYVKAGGKRKSERKRPVRKPKNTK